MTVAICMFLCMCTLTAYKHQSYTLFFWGGQFQLCIFNGSIVLAVEVNLWLC